MSTIKIYRADNSNEVLFEGVPTPSKNCELVACNANDPLIDVIDVSNNTKIIAGIDNTKIKRKDGSAAGANATEVKAYLDAEFTPRTLTDGADYAGQWNATTNSPDLTTITHSSGDFYYVGVEGVKDPDTGLDGGVTYEVNDKIIYNGASFDHIKRAEVTVNELVNSAVGAYDIFVDPTYSGTTYTGSFLQPYLTIPEAIAVMGSGDRIWVANSATITEAITLPADKSVRIDGPEGVTVGYASFASTNDNVFYQGDSTSTATYYIGVTPINGKYGIRIKGAASVTAPVRPKNCGWSGNRLNPKAAQTGDWASGGTLGYDSSQADLLAFWASSETSNGGAIRIENTPFVNVKGAGADTCARGVRLQDCGIGGKGIATEMNTRNTLESGIYLASSTRDSRAGCENVLVSSNTVDGAANNGILSIGGKNNTIGLNHTDYTWNAGVMVHSPSQNDVGEVITRNYNLSNFNAVGNVGDAKGGIAIEADATHPMRAGSEYIANIDGIRIANGGQGSNTEKIGLYVSDTLDNIPAGTGTLIIGKMTIENPDVGVDILCNGDVVRIVRTGQLTVINATERDFRLADGAYHEMPYQSMQVGASALELRTEGQKISISIGEDGKALQSYVLSDLQATEFGSHIRIMLRDTDKIVAEATVAGTLLNGVALNSTLSTAVAELNAMFQTSGGPTGQTPTVTSSTAVSMVAGSTLNYELTADYGVGYEWSNLPAGVMTVDGNARKLIGGSQLTAGTYSIGVRVTNYVGFVDATITLTVSAAGAFSNNYSVLMQNQDNMRIVNDAGGILAPMERASNNDGKAWTLSKWIKTANDSRSQVWFHIGGGTSYTATPFIEIRQVNTTRIRLRYGIQGAGEYVELETAGGSFPHSQFNHLVVTFGGGDTSSSNASRGDQFKIYVNGSAVSATVSGSGFDGAISNKRFRIGRTFNSASIKGGYDDEMAVFNTAYSASQVATLYNSGTPTDLSGSASSWYRFGDGANDGYPYIYDEIDNTNNDKRMEMQNQTSANIVSDAP